MNPADPLPGVTSPITAGAPASWDSTWQSLPVLLWIRTWKLADTSANPATGEVKVNVATCPSACGRSAFGYEKALQTYWAPAGPVDPLGPTGPTDPVGPVAPRWPCGPRTFHDTAFWCLPQCFPCLRLSTRLDLPARRKSCESWRRVPIRLPPRRQLPSRRVRIRRDAGYGTVCSSCPPVSWAAS
jgi:hypothetical protein